jgi:hypothetical protein
MKSQSSGVAVLSAFVLTSPLLTFGKSDVQDLAGATRAVEQGKGRRNVA